MAAQRKRTSKRSTAKSAAQHVERPMVRLEYNPLSGAFGLAIGLQLGEMVGRASAFLALGEPRK